MTELRVPANVYAEFAVLSQDDSMETAHIRKWDTVYCVQNTTVSDGDIVAVQIAGKSHVLLRKVFFNTNGHKVQLRACSPYYRDMTFAENEMDLIKILGKAVAVLSQLENCECEIRKSVPDEDNRLVCGLLSEE